MNPYILLNFITFLLLIPISIIIGYLKKHFKDKNGEIGTLRKIIFYIKVGWFVYLVGQIFVTYEISKGFTPIQEVPFLIVSILPIMIIHWWALFTIRRLLQ